MPGIILSIFHLLYREYDFSKQLLFLLVTGSQNMKAHQQKTNLVM